MQTLKNHITYEFSSTFRHGVNLYLEGKWEQARPVLETANQMMAEAAPELGGDGPSQTLLQYMEARDWRAPDSWKGYRPLTSK